MLLEIINKFSCYLCHKIDIYNERRVIAQVFQEPIANFIGNKRVAFEVYHSVEGGWDRTH